MVSVMDGVSGQKLSSAPSRTFSIRPEISSEFSTAVVILPGKASADILDYGIEFSTWFETVDSLKSATFKVVTDKGTDTELTVRNFEFDDSLVTFLLDSGVPGTTYTFAITITTTQGLKLTQPISILVNTLSAATKPSDDIQLLPSDSMLAAWLATLPASDPSTANAVWDDNGIAVLSETGATNITTKSYMTSESMDVWLASLPVVDPNMKDSFYNNAGIPTLSRAGSSGGSNSFPSYVWTNWLLTLPVAGATLPSGQWVNNSGIAVRT